MWKGDAMATGIVALRRAFGIARGLLPEVFRMSHRSFRRRMLDSWMKFRSRRSTSAQPRFAGLESLEGRLMLSAAVIGDIDDLTVARNTSPTVIALADKFDDTAVSGTLVRFQTDLGNYVLHLYDTATPITVANFLNYVEDGDYIDSFFHRTATIGSTEIAIVQGGGFTIDNFTLDVVPTDPPIVNEFSASRPNVRGTIAMAKTANPDSATSQFFFNTINNPALDNPANSGGFTVFGEVYGGMAVIDAIADLPRFNINAIFGLSASGPLGEVPLRNIQGSQLDGEANFVVMRGAAVVDELTYAVSSSNPSLVTAAVVNGLLQLTYAPDADGSANITVTATDQLGNAVQQVFSVDVQSLPVANDDNVTVVQGTSPVTVNVLANDTDADGALVPSTLTIVTGPESGAIEVNEATGVVTFVPPSAEFLGTVTFSYTVDDNDGNTSNVATATVTISTQLPPVGNDDAVRTPRGQAVDIDVLANDTDAEDGIDPTTVTIVDTANHGTTQVDPVTGVVTYTPAAGFVGTDTFTYIFADDAAAVSQEATVTVVVDYVVTVDGDTVKSVTYTDGDGTEVTIDVKNGNANLVFDVPANVTQTNNKGKVTLAGGASELLTLNLTQSGDSTQVKVKTKGGTDGLAAFGDILAEGSVQQIAAKTVNLLGDVSIGGSLEKLELNNIAASGLISIGAGTGNKELQIKLNAALATSIDSQIGIKQLQAESWVGSGAAVGTIQAPYVGQLKINDDLQVNLNLLNGVAGLEDVLGKVQVKDQIIGGTWQLNGGGGVVQADSITGAFVVTADGEFDGVKTKGDAAGSFTADFVGSLSVGGDAIFSIITDGIKSLAVKGDLSDTTITLGGTFDPSVKALGKLDVKGIIDTLTLNSVNSLGKIGATTITDSEIFAGVGALGAGESLPNESGDYAHMAKIDGVTIKGKKDGTADYTRTNIAAWELGKVKLSVVNGNNADLPFGVGASILGGIDGEILGGDKFKFSKLDDPQAFQDQLVDSGIDLDDFRIELV
jgi:peptidyl-prolyl cis-trans isomerase A (cyclophilin A)